MLNEIKEGQIFFDCRVCKLKIDYYDVIDWECGQCRLSDWDMKKVKFVPVKGILGGEISEDELINTLNEWDMEEV